MSRTFQRVCLSMAALIASGVAAAMTGQGPAETAQRRWPNPWPNTAEQFDQMFAQYSNWGRWGKDDQIGALNLVTDAKRRQAASLVKSGISVSMAHIPAVKKSASDKPGMWELVMGPGPTRFTSDYQIVRYHGTVAQYSHIDALCGWVYKNKVFNGNIPNTNPAGCEKLGIEHVKNGIVTRGVLIDIPRLKGLPYLEPHTPVFVEDIEAWEKKAGVKLTVGDALFLRTGRTLRDQRTGVPLNETDFPGFHVSVGPWLRKRDVAAIGSDIVADVLPSTVEGIPLSPMHTFITNGLGINLMPQLDLEAVAETAAKLNRWEFMVTVPPMPVAGATGSPVNPLAIF
jgi:kynurenine formamidase